MKIRYGINAFVIGKNGRKKMRAEEGEMEVKGIVGTNRLRVLIESKHPGYSVVWIQKVQNGN